MIFTVYCLDKPIKPALNQGISLHYEMSELDDKSTEIELSEDIDRLSSDKASGNDTVSVEVFNDNNEILLSHLRKLRIDFEDTV